MGIKNYNYYLRQNDRVNPVTTNNTMLKPKKNKFTLLTVRVPNVEYLNKKLRINNENLVVTKTRLSFGYVLKLLFSGIHICHLIRRFRPVAFAVRKVRQRTSKNFDKPLLVYFSYCHSIVSNGFIIRVTCNCDAINNCN